MNWNDKHMDPEEAFLMVNNMGSESDNDYAMLVENKGKVVEGESDRSYEDGKQRMDINGYYTTWEVQSPPGSTKGQVVAYGFCVVRECDAATASIASMLKNQDSDIRVTVSVFKAGGDSSTDMQPHLEFVLEGARVKSHVILTAGTPRRAREVIHFMHKSLEIRSAPQSGAGQRGAVRTCVIQA